MAKTRPSDQARPDTSTAHSAAEPAAETVTDRRHHARDTASRAGRRDTVGVPVPGLGTVHLSRPQLGYVAGIVVLTATELVSWPVGLALATGHLLAADRDSRTVEDIGDALEQA